MPVDSKTVSGRRNLSFASLDEVLDDAARLVASPQSRTLGNWSIDRLLAHLALAVDGSIDGISAKVPLIVRLVGPLIKRRVLNRRMSPGFRLPQTAEQGAFPAGLSPREALDKLTSAVARSKNEPMTARHPVFGKLTHAEWTQFHLRHAEMHLSFVVPE